MENKTTQWLNKTNQFSFAIFLIAGAFITYFSMYAFRKPFTAAEYEGLTVFGFDYKIVAVFTQVIGYTTSKFFGIKIISELKAASRIKIILVLIGIAWLSLLLFGVIPEPYNVWILFFNGLPLGMIWGVVYSFLEGRRFTELLGAGLSSSFIVSSGVVKASGKWLMNDFGVPEFWMPFLTGLLFIPTLFIGVWMLSKIPPPTAEDEKYRTKRVPMDGKERAAFFSTFGLGIILTTIIYIFLTIFRDLRDNFAVELWKALGYGDRADVLATAEIPIAIGVLIIIGLMVFIKNNKTAFYVNKVMIIFAGFMMIFTTVMFQSKVMSPAAWMIVAGFSVYLAYIAFHTFLYERWIALFKYESNIGFLMYIADAFGYLGSISILFAKNAFEMNQNLKIDWLSFFIYVGYVTGFVTIILGVWVVFYFMKKEKQLLNNN